MAVFLWFMDAHKLDQVRSVTCRAMDGPQGL